MTVMVFPCGSENGLDETQRPYELQIRKRMNENSLKDIFGGQKQLWEPIFQSYIQYEGVPNFSVYRKPYFKDSYSRESDQLLHILYMKSTAKSLSRNYNAANVGLEVYCQNRFYGPLVVAINLNRPPYYLESFSLKNLESIERANQSAQNIIVKDDFVLKCLWQAPVFQENLNSVYKNL